jgi:ABC-type dipeptide/oligopeptide/nickel transport system permease subunit
MMRTRAGAAVVGAQMAVAATPTSRPLLRRFRRVLGLWGRVTFGFLVLVVVLAAFPRIVVRHDPIEVVPEQILAPPGADFLFGTDQYGRDIFSRVVYGARASLGFALIATGISVALSTVAGTVSAYYGGRLETLLMRTVDILMAFPGILLALIVVALLGPGLATAMIAVGFGQAPAFTRIVRSATLVVKNQQYIEAARAMGAPDMWIMRAHVLPNVRYTVIVLMTLGFGASILIGASLSFLGLGAQPPTPEWGSMLGDARGYVRTHWWVPTLPGLVLAATLLCINTVGDQIRDILDPRLKLQ